MFRKMALVVGVLLVAIAVKSPGAVYAYEFGDYKSATLVGKAWKAFGSNDLEGVLAYTNKCIELYAAEAKKMQDSLSAYPTGSNDTIFAYWALNDVATAYFIQGEAYRKAEMPEEAKQAYQRVVDEFGFGQCWDTGGWFWKPAEAAKVKINMLVTGSTIDFGDNSSAFLVGQAWKALADKDLEAVNTYVNHCLEMYEQKAQEMQDSLTEYPWESKEKIFSYWALNDVGTALFIKGEAYRNAGDMEEARKAYKKLVDSFYYAQTWDPAEFFWKPAEAAQQKLEQLDESNG